MIQIAFPRSNLSLLHAPDILVVCSKPRRSASAETCFTNSLLAQRYRTFPFVSRRRLSAISRPTMVFPAPVFRSIKLSSRVLFWCHCANACAWPSQRSLIAFSRTGRERRMARGSTSWGLLSPKPRLSKSNSKIQSPFWREIGQTLPKGQRSIFVRTVAIFHRGTERGDAYHFAMFGSWYSDLMMAELPDGMPNWANGETRGLFTRLEQRSLVVPSTGLEPVRLSPGLC